MINNKAMEMEKKEPGSGSTLIGVKITDLSTKPKKKKSKGKAPAEEEEAEVASPSVNRLETEKHNVDDEGPSRIQPQSKPGWGFNEVQTVKRPTPLLPLPASSANKRSPTADKAIRALEKEIRAKKEKTNEDTIISAGGKSVTQLLSETAAERSRAIEAIEKKEAENRLREASKDLTICEEDAEIARRLSNMLRSGAKLIKVQKPEQQYSLTDSDLIEISQESSSKQWEKEEMDAAKPSKESEFLRLRWMPIVRGYIPEKGDDRYGCNLKTDLRKGQWRMSREALKEIVRMPCFTDQEMKKWFKSKLTIYKPLENKVTFSKRLEPEFQTIYFVSQKVRDLRMRNKVRRELDYMYWVMSSEGVGERGTELIHGPLHIYLHLYQYFRGEEVNPIICFKRHLKQTSSRGIFYIDHRVLMILASLHVKAYNANWYFRENVYAGNLHTRYVMKCMGFDQFSTCWFESRISIITDSHEYPIPVPFSLRDTRNKLDYDSDGYWKKDPKPNVVYKSERVVANDDNLLFLEHHLYILCQEEIEMADWQRENCTKYWNYMRKRDEIDAYQEHCRVNNIRFVSETMRELYLMRRMEDFNLPSIAAAERSMDSMELFDDVDDDDNGETINAVEPLDNNQEPS